MSLSSQLGWTGLQEDYYLRQRAGCHTSIFAKTLWSGVIVVSAILSSLNLVTLCKCEELLIFFIGIVNILEIIFLYCLCLWAGAHKRISYRVSFLLPPSGEGKLNSAGVF